MIAMKKMTGMKNTKMRNMKRKIGKRDTTKVIRNMIKMINIRKISIKKINTERTSTKKINIRRTSTTRRTGIGKKRSGIGNQSIQEKVEKMRRTATEVRTGEDNKTHT